MALAYREPGVSVSEVVTPQVSPFVAAPADICVVGLTQGFQQRTDQIRMTGSAAIPLPGLPAGAALTAVLTVKDVLDPSKGAANGSGYTITTDYTVSTTNGTITRVTASPNLLDGTVVNITYTYVPNDYWLPTRMFDGSSVESRYGSALTTNGLSVNSPLSLAATIAFENGASSVICMPLLARGTPGDPTSTPGQPTATQAAATTTWSDTLFAIRDIEDINVLIPVVGQSMANVGDSTQLAILQTVQDHIQFMKTNQQYVMGVFGEDASAANTVAQKATIRTHASTLAGRYGGETAEQIILISPAKFKRALPSFGASLFLGGQYAAAAIGGMLASRAVSSSLTRKIVSGFVEIADPRFRQDKNDDASAGLLLLEQNSGLIQVRHSVTLDTTSSARREVSVVRSKHRVIESVRATLDNQIIGNLIADSNAPYVVAAAVTAVLAELLQSRDIVDYSPVQARLVSLEPTTIQVRFSYRPAFPVNYIDIQFSLDLTNADVSEVAAL
jgi:hypothetical protein